MPTITGKSSSETLRGTDEADRIIPNGGEDIIYGTSGAMCRWKNDWRRVLLKSEEKLVQKYMTEAQEIVLSKAEGLRRMLLRQLADCKPEDVVVITDEES